MGDLRMAALESPDRNVKRGSEDPSSGRDELPSEPGLWAVTTEPWKLGPVSSLVVLSVKERPLDSSDPTLDTPANESDHIGTPSSKVTRGKRGPAWVQREHAMLPALKSPSVGRLSGTGPVFCH